jgi:phenylalanyl-tRNA synthetase beta chain
MRVSLGWIKRILGRQDLGLSVADLQAKLTLHLAEFEADVERSGPNLDGVVVGKVLTCVQHPGADRLRCTTVDIGTGTPVPVVCGAPNVAAGQTVAVATIGTKLTMPDKDGKPTQITIKASKLRGEPSEGMICAEDELGLGTSHDGIMVLKDDLPAGMPLGDALGIGDTVLLIENHAITHRPDLWGQWGWAREVAAILGLPPPAVPATAWQPQGSGWSVQLTSEGCTTYCGAVVEGVSNVASPKWMQDLLNGMGVRPLGLLVDVTNFVMLELGEPMHAFDRREIAGSTLIVRDAADGEAFTTLDGKAHKLTGADIVIADDQRALALAGIMGGQGSMVRDDTSTIVLEAATFLPARIRRTRQRVGIATDSSARFEKGLYPELTAAAITRAIQLLTELCPNAKVTHRFSAGVLSAGDKRVTLPPGELTRLTSLTLSGDQQRELLARLGFQTTGNDVAIPWWRRKDVGSAADLVEEIARLHGYHHIRPAIPRLPAAAPAVNVLRQLEHRARSTMSALGWDEVSCYGFTSEKWIQALGLQQPFIRLSHPLSSEQTVLRPSLLPNLLQAVALNQKHSEDAVCIYEIGKRYWQGVGIGNLDETPNESVVIAGVYSHKDEKTPFFNTRDTALALIRGLGYDIKSLPPHKGQLAPWLTSGRTTTLHVVHQTMNNWIAYNAHGVCTEIPRELREIAGCQNRVGYFEIYFSELVGGRKLGLGAPRPISHRAPSRFPLVERQFTFDCPEELPYGDLELPMRQAAGDLFAGAALDSIYRGDQLSAGRKAVSLRIFLQAQDRTLEEKELVNLHQRIITSVEKRTPAKLKV